MRFVAMSLSILMLSPVMASRALASEPASQATSPETSSSASQTKSNASAAQASKIAKPQELTAAEKSLLSQGYKMRLIDGEKRFCRKETVLGSNLERTVCTTAARVAESQQMGRDITEQIQRNQVNPHGH